MLLWAAVVNGQTMPPVTVALVESARVSDELRLTGTVTSERTAALSTQVSGLVKRVRVDAGDRVAAGKALINLDATMAKLALERSGAAVEEARAQLAEQQRLYDEAKEMFNRGLVPETRKHAAEAEWRVASARVERLAAEQREQQEIVRRHTLVAPFSGVVSNRYTDPGEWVETGTPVLELVDLRRLRIDVQVPQERYEQIAVGSSVKVEVDTLLGEQLEGKVSVRVPVKDPNARTFLVRVTVKGASKLMTPGMSAWVIFPLSGASAVRVPRDAIVRKSDGSTTVWVVNDGDTTIVSERQVRLGRSLRNWVDVHGGLEAGMRIVVRGNETLTEGQQVRILATVPSNFGSD
ncbi:MAG: efflux RND transporter periplasmic adaptor subunit [Burkholderiales bacterium]|nr:efflux RND transporter periplasmic adaptor subunit [Burkholderiales bacterium]